LQCDGAFDMNTENVKLCLLYARAMAYLEQFSRETNIDVAFRESIVGDIEEKGVTLAILPRKKLSARFGQETSIAVAMTEFSSSCSPFTVLIPQSQSHSYSVSLTLRLQWYNLSAAMRVVTPRAVMRDSCDR